MTRLGGPGDDRVGESGDEALAAAREIAEAVDGLAHLWAVAAQGALVRLSPQQLQALRVLQAGPGMNLTALAEATGLAMPAASRLCDRLEAAGLLGRTLHPRNRREVRLELTALGIQVLGDVADRRAEALAAVLAAIDTDTREALVRGMRGFARARWGADGRPRLSP